MSEVLPPASRAAQDCPAARVAAPGPQALTGLRLGVVGLGESGLAMVRWCVARGAQVRVLDSRADPPGLAGLRASCPEVAFEQSDFDPLWLEGLQAVAWTQGLSPEQGPAAPLYAAARAQGLAVWGELDFFAAEIAALKAAGRSIRVAAITGTNGKTTTTRLLGHLCRQAGWRVAVAGNIGPPALEALRAALDENDLPDLWVLELASYQLALANILPLDGAALLNLSADHLDWHASFEAYAGSKQRIFAAARVCVCNRDDPATWPDGQAPGSHPQRPKARGRSAMGASVNPAREVVGFGLDTPAQAGGFGVLREDAIDWLVEAVTDLEESIGRRPRSGGPVRIVRLMPADDLRIRGAHNQANALAALALGRALGLPTAAMLHGLRSFAGEPHRCQHIATRAGVQWFDDSKGTNVGATLAALKGLGRPVVLILGGDGKGQDFSVLAEGVSACARAVLLIGRDAPIIRAALADTGVPLIDCASLPEAVCEADRQAQAGDAVLLSPACASFDMFRNYAHRAEVFAQALSRLPNAVGAPC